MTLKDAWNNVLASAHHRDSAGNPCDESYAPIALKIGKCFAARPCNDGFLVCHPYDSYGPEQTFSGDTPIEEVEAYFADWEYIPNQFGHGGNWKRLFKASPQ